MLTTDVRHRVYRAFLDTGAAPPVHDLARELNTSVVAIEDALIALEAGHALVLAPATRGTVWMAHPFSNVITDYRVVAGDGTWWANCAWDTFGIASLLSRDADIHSRCACCGDAITLAVRDGAIQGQALVHFVVPPRRFWDNVGYT
jgi:Alkylmercury lyase